MSKENQAKKKIKPGMVPPKSPKVRRYIWVTFQKAGFHRYPDAPEEVAYLRQRHRHLFKFKVAIAVTHDNRDIEFHMFLNYLQSLVLLEKELNDKSCEMIADVIYSGIEVKYGPQPVIIEVAEDGECGSTTYYNH